MGYFSNKHIDLQSDDTVDDRLADHLLWRYEDLKERYFTLLEKNAPCFEDIRFTIDDYRYAPIESFHSLRDVYRALKIVKEDLKIKYGITPEDDMLTDENAEEENEQMTICEIVLLPTWFQTAAAA